MRAPRDPESLPAVIGIGCRLPGGVNDPTALWQALIKGEPLTRPIPTRRWAQLAARLHPDQRPETPWTAGVIDDTDAFDAGFFGVAGHEAAQMDPQQRMALEVVVEALADAGIAPGALRGTRTGVWAGSASPDHAVLTLASGQKTSMGTLSGAASTMLANQVSYLLDLRGPSMSVDTACSASATALHLARQSLELDEVDTAVVIGANVMLMPGIIAGFFDGGVLAADGVCRPFDETGVGYVRAEAVVATVLRRSGDAREHGDRVYAVVRGSATNSDGRSAAGLYAPNPPAHVALLRDAYRSADLDPAQADYVQCHGTGTKAGDSSEGRALARVLGVDRTEPLPIGSAKSVLGHGEGSAGLVGVVCAALALHHGVIPPTAAHTTIRPTLARLPLRVPVAAEPWPQTGRPRVAGVSAFGFGGSNVHIILEQAPETAPDSADGADAAPAGIHHLIPVSAATAERLHGTAAAWAPTVTGAEFAAVAATAQHRRDHLPVRAAVIADDADEAAAALGALARGRAHPALVGPVAAPAKPGPLVWLFCGHGSQHPAMARSAHARLPVFRAAFDAAAEALSTQLGRPTWRPGQPIDGFETAQHAIFCVQIAQTATWRDWGYEPHAVLGHSLGEVAAAHAAGALSVEQAARVVAARSALLAQTEALGGLLVTDLTPEQAEAAIAEHTPGALVVAAHNAPDTTVISGPEQPLHHLRLCLERRDAYVRRVAQDVPAHSPAVEPLLETMAAALAGLTPRTGGATVFHSTAEAAPVPAERLDAHYWTHQLRAPVRLVDTLVGAVDTDAVVVEIGARSTLARAASATLAGVGTTTTTVIAAGDTDRDDHAALLGQLGALYTAGHTPARWPAPQIPPTRLPVYWDRGHHQADPAAVDLATALARHDPDHTAVTTALTRLVADTLATNPDQLDPHRSLTELGITSVAVIGLRDAIRAAHPALAHFGIRALLDDTDLDRLATTIGEQCHNTPAGHR